MNARTLWPIFGGIKPVANKTQSNATPIQFAGIPPELIFSLVQRNADAVPVVCVGQWVRKGELIAQAGDEFGAPIHASSSGEIIAIEARPVAHVNYLSATCIVIRTDGLDQWIEREPADDIASLNVQHLIERIRHAGVVGAGGAGFPAARKLLDAHGNIVRIETLIINGAECEPYITADDRLMRERANDIVRGTEILARILSPGKILIGVEDEQIFAIEAMRTACEKIKIESSSVEIVTLPSIYPMGGEGQIIQALTGKEVPFNENPAAIGVLCFNVGTVAAIYRAVALNEPMVARVTTIAGRACMHNGNFDVLIGTPLMHVLQQAGFQSDQCTRLIAGGALMGVTAASVDIPISKTGHCFIAGTTAEFPPLPAEQACIRCGFCSEVCPVQLLPQQLHAYARAQNHELLHDHNLFDCIECGACDYVCPSSIQLTTEFRAAKRELHIIDYEQQQAPQAKARFIAHQQRITREQQERDSQRQRRLENSSIKKLSENNLSAVEPDENDTRKNFINENEADKKQAAIQAAIARVKAKKNLGTQRLAVAAALSAVESPVARLRKRIAEIEALMLEADAHQHARLQIALDDLQSHLADVEANPDATLDAETTRAIIEQALLRARGDEI